MKSLSRSSVHCYVDIYENRQYPTGTRMADPHRFNFPHKAWILIMKQINLLRDKLLLIIISRSKWSLHQLLFHLQSHDLWANLFEIHARCGPCRGIHWRNAKLRGKKDLTTVERTILHGTFTKVIALFVTKYWLRMRNPPVFVRRIRTGVSDSMQANRRH